MTQGSVETPSDALATVDPVQRLPDYRTVARNSRIGVRDARARPARKAPVPVSLRKTAGC